MTLFILYTKHQSRSHKSLYLPAIRNKSSKSTTKKRDKNGAALKSLIDSYDNPESVSYATSNNKYHDKIHQNIFPTGKQRASNVTSNLNRTRKELYNEAHFMTKSLYRTCLRSVRLMKPGNEHDEINFQLREKEWLDQLDEKSSSRFQISYEPPVDRKNELQSRALYYLAWLKEGFAQEVDCLRCNPWREDNIHRFVYLMMQGEERRKWILKDYKFDDPYLHKALDVTRLKVFESRALQLVEDVYNTKGWVLKSDFSDKEEVSDGDDNDIWDCEDDYDDTK